MKSQTPPSELALAFDPLRPDIYRAVGYSTLISLLALAPTVYMLEVYERVVFGWVLMAATGWIVRGFMGIPRGRDSRPVT